MSIADNLPHQQPYPPDLLDPGPAPTCPRSADAPPDPRAWLDHISAPKRSAVSNWFHYAVRQGAQTPHAVCSTVWQTVEQRLQWSSDLTKRQFLQSVLDLLQAHQDEALAYAKYVIDYEQLPYAERQKIKGRRALGFVMQGKEPTLPQLAYLRSLGHQGPPPVDRAQASLLIDQLRQQQGGGR